MSRPTRLRAVTITGALAGLSLGLGTAVIAERMVLDAGPPGWTARTMELPVVLSQNVGAPALPGDGWPLASHAEWVAPGTGVAELAVEARLPESGHLELRLNGGQRGRSAALQLDRGPEPYAMVVSFRDTPDFGPRTLSAPQPMSCDTVLPAPEEEVAASFAREKNELVATLTTGGKTTTTRCAFRSPGGEGASVRSGLRRIGLRTLSTPSARIVAPHPSGWMRALGGLIGMLVLAGGARAAFRRGWVGNALLITSLLPLLAVFPLSFVDLVSALQAVRVVPEEPVLAAVVGPAFVSAAGVFFAACARLATSRHTLRPTVAGASGVVLGAIALPGFGALGSIGLPLAGLAAGVLWRLQPRELGRGPLPGMLLGGLFGMVAVAALAPLHGMAITFAGVVGVCLAALVWVNVARPRGWNPASLILCVLVVFFANQGLRWTALGMRLTGQSARAASPSQADELGGTFSSFEALEHRREWQEYPLQDYPVAPPERRPGVPRIVAMGGSSTGGAWQNDNLDQFWPATLERTLGGSHQVVNLGVGGWTTFHIRRFLETRLDVADPDLIVLYVGHNDILTSSPRPYNDLHAAWLAGGQADLVVSSALSRVPLYQLARFALHAASGRNEGAAVPLVDARDNLLDIIALLEPRGGRLLLTREALSPDSSALDPYGKLLAEVARTHDSVGYVDIASQLSGPRGAGAFIDDCHLTEVGHARVAAMVQEGLTEAGWLPSSPAR